MKKILSIAFILTFVVSITAVSGLCTSCSSSKGEVMYQTKNNNSKVIKSNYKVRGNNRDNRNTYRAY